MNWSVYHAESERLAVAGQIALRHGDIRQAQLRYGEAARAEAAAFEQLSKEKERTRAVTAISVVSLHYKSGDLKAAETSALEFLAREGLLQFAVKEIQHLLQIIWGETAIESAGLKFAKQDIFVSVSGGEILTGGAPLDLILRKVEEIRSLFFRTVEWAMKKPLRLRGAPPHDIQELFRPWLFQAPPGSYQFAVRLEAPKQLEFGHLEGFIPGVDEVTRHFIEIVNAAAADPDDALRARVEDEGYRNAFLKLARNLAPTGKSYEKLAIRTSAEQGAEAVVFVPESRRAISDTIQRSLPTSPAGSEGTIVSLRGILRAVHLDQDWLEVTIRTPEAEHVRVQKAGEAIDDVVGPMINRSVVVETSRSPSGTHYFRDIQAAE